jgi:ATP-dependent protease HslVU (ClpYQ) peptidase subunit
MTTILGVQYKNGFVIVADSQITDNERYYSHPDVKKIVKVGDYVIAGAGTSALVDVFQTDVQLPAVTVDTTTGLFKFLYSTFIPELRRLHAECGYTPKESDGFEFLLGVKNQLFYIAGDYSIIRSDIGIYGLGTGSNYAIGAVSAGASPKEAVKIATKLDVNSGGYIQIVKQGEQDA